MLLDSFFRYVDSHGARMRARGRAAPARPIPGRLFIEHLEARIVPSFLTPVNYAAGNRPVSVAVGDFNNDGIPDLVVANNYSDNVSVLLGNGDGTFQPARNFDAGGLGPTSVAVGDFNGDGNLDLAVVGWAWVCVEKTCDVEDETVRILLGNGDGTFQTARTFAAGELPVSVTVGDFNGDGIPDLAVADAGYYEQPVFYYAGVRVFLGNGDGTFHQSSFSAFGQRSPSAMAAEDFNGDGIPDLAVANGNSNTVSVLLGMGDGTFQAARTFVAGNYPSSVAVADFNGDGLLDLAVGHGSSFVSVLLGNGDGTFQAARDFIADGYSSVAVGDFNGDGNPDLVTGASLLLGNGDGTFQTRQRHGGSGGAVAVADFNADSWPDLAVSNAVSNNVSILLNDGDWPTSPGGAPGRGSRPGFGSGDGLFVQLPPEPQAAVVALHRVARYEPRVDESSTAPLPQLPAVAGADALFAAPIVEDRREAPVSWRPRAWLAVDDRWWDVRMERILNGSDG